MKKLIPLFTLLLTFSAFSSVSSKSSDDLTYRAEIRQMLMEHHKPITDWRYAKDYLMKVVHLQQDEQGFYIKDVYCNRIIRSSVGPRKFPKNNNINVEHTWPQSKFPVKKSAIQKSDLHHLYPTDSRANSRRGNYHFADVPDAYGLKGCEASKRGYSASTGDRNFMPPAEQIGNVARALFYFSVRYNVEIPDYEEVFLRQWHLLDPVDEFELRRNDLIEKAQGNRNIFIDEPEFIDLIDNF